MATDKAIGKARQALRERIFTLLSSAFFDRPDELAHAVHPILAEILEALSDLDNGEIPLAFRKVSPSHKGIKPAEVANLRLRAVSYIRALVRRGVDLPNATATIAKAFQRGEDAVAKWRLAELKRARAGDETSMLSVDLVTLNGLDAFAHKMGRGLSIKQIIAKAKVDGERLNILQPNYSKARKK